MDVGSEIGPVTGSPRPDFITAYHDTLRAELARLASADAQTRPQYLQALGEEWLEASRRGVATTLQLFVDGGMDVNYQDPRTGQSALHAAAGSGARQSVRTLLRTVHCDFLVRDSAGRLPSECAYLFGHDVALARLLGNKERKQAAELVVSIARRP